MEDMIHDTSVINDTYDNLYDKLYHTIKKKGSKNQYPSTQQKNITNMIINKKCNITYQEKYIKYIQ